MVKYYEAINTFFYTWDQVARAFWQRYPNPYSNHVLSEDTVFREMRGNSLYTKRLLTKTNSVPKWGEKFIKNTIVSIVEESYIDPYNKTISTFTRNIGYARVMGIVEQVDYTVSPDNLEHTRAERRATVDSQIYGFRRAIEGFGIKRFKKNCNKAILGFNHILALLYPSQQTQEEKINVKNLSHGQSFHASSINSKSFIFPKLAKQIP